MKKEIPANHSLPACKIQNGLSTPSMRKVDGRVEKPGGNNAGNSGH